MGDNENGLVCRYPNSEFNTIIMQYQRLLKIFILYNIQRLEEIRSFIQGYMASLRELVSPQTRNGNRRGEQSRLIKDFTEIEKRLWSWQEAIRRYLDILYNWKITRVSDVQRLIELLTNNIRILDSEETCQNLVNHLEWMNLSPCVYNTIVTIKEEYALNELNTCTLIIRDALNRKIIKKEGNEYDLSIKIRNGQGNPVYITIDEEEDGKITINFLPITTTLHSLFVKINSIPIPSSPYILFITDHSHQYRDPITFGEFGTGTGQFNTPWGICSDSYGRIYVSDRCNHRIQVFDEKGNFLLMFGQKGEGKGEFNRPCGIAADLYQRIIVADKDNHRIQIFLSNGTYINHFGRYESEEESLFYPWDVAVNCDNHIAVTEGQKKRIRLFNDKGDRIAECRFNCDGLKFPRGITSMMDGSFLVTDFNAHKIVFLNAQLQVISSIGSRGGDVQQFNRPQGIAVNNDGLIAVSDYRNQRIQLYIERKPHKIIKNNFDSLQGIAFHANGGLLVVDSTKNNIKIFNFNNNNIYPSDPYFADSTWID